MKYIKFYYYTIIGSQRQSIISSVTTVSSSRDELIEALENAKRNPPPPVLYESQPDSSSQPTDSSDPTEPGIVQFTQSPPKPNEQREASCEVHYTGRQKMQMYKLGEKSVWYRIQTPCSAGELSTQTLLMLIPAKVKFRNETSCDIK